MIEQIQIVIKRMRWKVVLCEMKGNRIITEKYGLKSQKMPPPINKLGAFENDLMELMKNIKFQTVQNQLQSTIKSDIEFIQQSSKTLTPADQTSNIYRLAKKSIIKSVEI